MKEDARQSYLTVATIMMALWSLKFLPNYVLAVVVVVVVCLSCVYSEVCEMSFSYIGYSYITKTVIIIYNDLLRGVDAVWV